MSKFDIYVKVSILINYKTKQPSKLAGNISLTCWLCDIGVHFCVRPSIHPSIHLSTFMSKFDIYVRVSILISYKNKQPSDLAWSISLTSWLGRYLGLVTLTYISHSSDFDTIYVAVPDLLKFYSHHTYVVLLLDVLTRQVPWPGDLDLYFVLQWLWHILRRCLISPQL